MTRSLRISFTRKWIFSLDWISITEEWELVSLQIIQAVRGPSHPELPCADASSAIGENSAIGEEVGHGFRYSGGSLIYLLPNPPREQQYSYKNVK